MSVVCRQFILFLFIFCLFCEDRLLHIGSLCQLSSYTKFIVTFYKVKQKPENYAENNTITTCTQKWQSHLRCEFTPNPSKTIKNCMRNWAKDRNANILFYSFCIICGYFFVFFNSFIEIFRFMANNQNKWRNKIPICSSLALPTRLVDRLIRISCVK